MVNHDGYCFARARKSGKGSGDPSATANKGPQAGGHNQARNAPHRAQRRKRTTGDTELKALLGHWRHTYPQAPTQGAYRAVIPTSRTDPRRQLSQPAGNSPPKWYPAMELEKSSGDPSATTNKGLQNAGTPTPQQTRGHHHQGTRHPEHNDGREPLATQS